MKTVPLPSIKADMLVAFFDLTHFARISLKLQDEEIIALMQEIFRRAGELIETAGGRLVKPIGDAGLVVFPEEHAEDGILALMNLKEEIDNLLAGKGHPCRLIVKINFGPVVSGTILCGSARFPDVYGKTVNAAAMLVSHGFAMTPSAFRMLSPNARKQFKKHTPPVRYIPETERHLD